MTGKINKHTMDEIIRLTRKYWSTGDADLLPAKSKQTNNAVLEMGGDVGGIASIHIGDVVSSCVYFNEEMTNEQIYAVFFAMGIGIEHEKKAEQ